MSILGDTWESSLYIISNIKIMQEKVEKLYEGVEIARKHNVDMFLQMKK